MLQNRSIFGGRIRELIAYLEAENRDQAEFALGDGVDYLRALLRPLPDRSKPSSLGARESTVPANDFGIERVRETLAAYDQARRSLARGDMQSALPYIRLALKAWEQKPTPEAQGD